MKFYKKPDTNEVYAYSDDGSQDHIIPRGLIRVSPEDVKGIVNPSPSNEQLAAAVRSDRNARLYASDWAVLPDVPLSLDEKIAWVEYRQSLRDVPSLPTFPQKIDWPISPKHAKKEK